MLRLKHDLKEEFMALVTDPTLSLTNWNRIKFSREEFETGELDGIEIDTGDPAADLEFAEMLDDLTFLAQRDLDQHRREISS
jgi:hypothetical protein